MKAVVAEDVANFLSPSPAEMTSPYEQIILEQDVTQQTSKQNKKWLVLRVSKENTSHWAINSMSWIDNM